MDVRDYKLSVLRDKISVALQKSEVFSDTFRGNIAWGNEMLSDEDINRAADIAQASEFINNKPDGMDTLLNQGGTSLSGGQKQRVAIARAVLKHGEIMILDDATSALDLRTEAAFYNELGKDHGSATKIIIAQRIASIQNADRIAVIENGTLAALGTHEELLENSSIYRDIYESQQKSAKA